MEEKKYCSKCGKEIKEECKFCNFCGNDLKNEIEEDTSKYIKKTKHINRHLIIWCMFIVLFASNIIYYLIQYKEYKEGQDFAVTSVMLVSDIFNSYKNDRKKLVNKMYEFYTQTTSIPSELLDYNPNLRTLQREAEEAQVESNKDLGELLRKNGYECYYGSYYLKYTDIFEYLSDSYFYVINFMLLMCVVITIVCTRLDKAKEKM